ncbi:MAG: exo-beta-N-acetylmuramidase NamZ domain-containing protein, partial [Vicinamibacterales bacterium]
MPVTLGSSHLVNSRRLKGRRVGIVSNPASVDNDFQHIVDLLKRDREVTVAALFGPQHGFRSDVQDNMSETPHTTDCTRGIPVYSLYSETREPTAKMLEGIDVLVIDLQDVGSRIYTFIYTMANCLRACARHGVDIIVCDRPNPIGGWDVEGPMLVSGYESFVGQFP